LQYPCEKTELEKEGERCLKKNSEDFISEKERQEKGKGRDPKGGGEIDRKGLESSEGGHRIPEAPEGKPDRKEKSDEEREKQQTGGRRKEKMRPKSVRDTDS